MNKGISKRIREIYRSKGMTKKSFAKSLDISEMTLSRWMDDDLDLKLSSIQKILKTYKNINPKWLVMGEGDMNRYSMDDSGNMVEEEKVEYNAMVESKNQEIIRELRKSLDYSHEEIEHLRMINKEIIKNIGGKTK